MKHLQQTVQTLTWPEYQLSPFGVSKTAPLHSPESNCGDKHAPLMPVKQEIWFHCSCMGIMAIAQRLTKG